MIFLVFFFLILCFLFVREIRLLSFKYKEKGTEIIKAYSLEKEKKARLMIFFLFLTIFLLICLLSKISALNGFPGGSMVKNLLANEGDVGLIPESGRSPGKGNGNSLRYSCLENPMDRGAWRTTVHRAAEHSDVS